MRTAIDSSVLLVIFNDEPGAKSWLDVLMQARREGSLVMRDVVYAEIAAAFRTEADLQEALRRLGAIFDRPSPAASWRAGMTFHSYRDAGGPREHLIPDFLIAAHALAQADRLAVVDRGYLRQYFADLPLLQP